MTKVFISYSFEVKDLSLINHIYNALSESDSYEATLTRAFDPEFSEVNPNLATINTCDFFIGIITSGSSRSQRKKVIEEIEHAKIKNLLAVLLIENNLSLEFDVPEGIEVIRFNREDEEKTLKNLDTVMKRHEAVSVEDLKKPNAVAWIIAGVVLVTIVALLIGSKKKE